MARIASTTTSGQPVDPTGGMTLDALMLRAKEAAQRRANPILPRDMSNPLSVVSGLAQSFAGGLEQGQAERAERAGREQLAKIRAGINLDSGPTGDQIAQASLLDPDYADRLTGLAADAVRARRLREQTLADRTEGRAYDERIAGQTRAYTEGNEGRINARELEEDKAAAAAAQAQESVVNERERLEAADVAKAAQQAEIAKEGRTATHYGPVITGPDAKTLGLDDTKSYQKNLKTDQYEPVGGSGGITIQNVPAEAAGRIGLSKNFLDNYDAIQAEVKAGNLTGPIDYTSAITFGRGSAGEAYRTIQAGSDSLLRNLTGAGMPVAEAEKYMRRYEPVAIDDADTLSRKIAGLKTDLENVAAAVKAGRKWLPETGAIDDGGTTPPTTYEAGKSYTFDDGSQATYKGGPPENPASWAITKGGQ